MKMFTKEKGFTLVELLVVLAIIGVLIGLAIGGIRIVQEVNRDTQRKALARDVQLALESYNEKHNSYPDELFMKIDSTKGVMDICACSFSGSCNSTCTGGEKVESKVAFDDNEYVAGACSAWDPSESEQVSSDFSYCFTGGAKAYTFRIRMERSGDLYEAGNE
jgi:prepilin-type N-terminal cleavage/methylation domain-containing protein